MPAIHDYFERACRRKSGPPAGYPGERCADAEGNSAVFWIEATPDGRIGAISYRCTTCFTLVALCEHLGEVVRGVTAAAAIAWTPQRVLALHPEVPASRRDRAALAAAALQSAVRKTFSRSDF